MNLNMIQNDKVTGYFKLNHSLLLDTEYRKNVNTRNSLV